MHSIHAAWAKFAGSSLLVLASVSGAGCAHGGSGTAAEPAEHASSASAAEPTQPSQPSGGGSAASGAADSGPVVVVHSADACPVVLERNGSLELHLDGNPSTGFSWQITDGASAVLTSRGEPSQSDGNGMPGSPAQYVYRFDATAAGQGRLELVYRRAWENGVAPAATFACAITVR